MLTRRLLLLAVVLVGASSFTGATSCTVFDESLRRTLESEASGGDGGRGSKNPKTDGGTADGGTTPAPPPGGQPPPPDGWDFYCGWSFLNDEPTGAPGCQKVAPNVFVSGKDEGTDFAVDPAAFQMQLDEVTCGVTTVGEQDVYELPITSGQCYQIDWDFIREDEAAARPTMDVVGPGVNTRADRRLRFPSKAPESGTIRFTVTTAQTRVRHKLVVRTSAPE